MDRLNVQEGSRIELSFVSLLVAQISGIMVRINDNDTKDSDNDAIDCLLPLNPHLWLKTSGMWNLRTMILTERTQ